MLLEKLKANNVKCSHKRQIARLQIILISNCQKYQIVSTVIMSSVKTDQINWCCSFGANNNSKKSMKVCLVRRVGNNF